MRLYALIPLVCFLICMFSHIYISPFFFIWIGFVFLAVILVCARFIKETNLCLLAIKENIKNLLVIEYWTDEIMIDFPLLRLRVVGGV